MGTLVNAYIAAGDGVKEALFVLSVSALTETSGVSIEVVHDK